MATTRRDGGKPRFDRETFSFTDRLKEIGMFFQKRSPQHQTMRRLVRRLQKAGIPYAIMGAMAVNAHGAERTTKDVDVLLTPEGLERFFGDVVFLIRTHNLDESFLQQLHASVHKDFIECLEEKRREDDYLAREG